MQYVYIKNRMKSTLFSIACCSTFLFNFHPWFGIHFRIHTTENQVNGNQGRYWHILSWNISAELLFAMIFSTFEQQKKWLETRARRCSHASVYFSVLMEKFHWKMDKKRWHWPKRTDWDKLFRRLDISKSNNRTYIETICFCDKGRSCALKVAENIEQKGEESLHLDKRILLIIHSKVFRLLCYDASWFFMFFIQFHWKRLHRQC